MTIGHAFLGLLEERPLHGYELKRRFDAELPGTKPMPFGQVYATLSRLTRDGLAQIAGVEHGEGPDRKLYVITPAGVAELESWLDRPQLPVAQRRGELFARVVVALLTGREPATILDAQRSVHLRRMRELTDLRRDADLVDQLACDLEIAHLEADIRWIERAGQRITPHRGGPKR